MKTIAKLGSMFVLASAFVLPPALAEAKDDPTRVELIEKGQVKLVLGKSDKGSLNGRKGLHGRKYSGRADSVRIHGKAGSVVTFFDNRRFQTNENFVVIKKKVDRPITVNISKNFVDSKEEAGNGIYRGSTAEFEWVLFKNVKKDFFTKYGIDEYLKDGKLPYGTKIHDGLQLAGWAKPKSRNYRVDNCSSVRFGT